MSSLDDLEKQYKPRSNKARDEDDRTPIEHEVREISGKAEVREVSKARSVASLFIKSDARSVGDSIVEDVVIPTINSMITEGLYTAIDMFFVGNGRRGRSRRRGSSRGDTYVSYRDYYDDDRRSSRRRRYDDDYDRRGYKRAGEVEGIEVDQRWEAEEIIDEMRRLIDLYDFVSVADVYKMVKRRADWTAERWGWRSVSGIRIEKMRGGGYEIIFPEPEKY